MVRIFLVLLLLAVLLTSCFGSRTQFHKKRYNYRFLAKSESEDNYIDKTKLYQLISVENKFGDIKVDRKTINTYIKFYEEGKVGKFYNFDEQDLESLNPLKANMGYYQCNDNLLKWATYYYLEVSAMGIASIACKEHPATSIIRAQEAGLIVLEDTDWESHITTLLENESFRKQLALHSIKVIWRDHSFTRKNLRKITSIFI